VQLSCSALAILAQVVLASCAPSHVARWLVYCVHNMANMAMMAAAAHKDYAETQQEYACTSCDEQTVWLCKGLRGKYEVQRCWCAAAQGCFYEAKRDLLWCATCCVAGGYGQKTFEKLRDNVTCDHRVSRFPQIQQNQWAMVADSSCWEQTAAAATSSSSWGRQAAAAMPTPTIAQSKPSPPPPPPPSKAPPLFGPTATTPAAALDDLEQRLHLEVEMLKLKVKDESEERVRLTFHMKAQVEVLKQKVKDEAEERGRLSAQVRDLTVQMQASGDLLLIMQNQMAKVNEGSSGQWTPWSLEEVSIVETVEVFP
jgi:hypothetical protein